MNVWYVLYGGISDDGRGDGKFAGRTEDKGVAREWFKRVKQDPYSVGGVRIIDDVSDRMAFRLEDFR